MKMLEINKIIQGDCIEQMKLLEENSVDAIITDPPYGLEFMGKDWDKFAPSDTNKERWKGKRKEMFVRDIVMPGTGFKQLPTSFGKKQNKKCKKCGHYFYSGTPCKCKEPEWEIRPNKFSIGLQEFVFKWAIACLRILKPGGFLLAMGGTRTYHRLVCGIEDAGFEIRDTIMWLYGSGFPKSLNIGKQIDKIKGNVREIVGTKITNVGMQGNNFKNKSESGEIKVTKGNSEWEGWGTALKPACEPIVVARKPLSEKNVALNVLKWGTGGINIDECRIKHNEELKETNRSGRINASVMNDKTCGFDNTKNTLASASPSGRFPTNIILDEETGKMLDEQSGNLSQGHIPKKSSGTNKIYGKFGAIEFNEKYLGRGGASRFFYCAKASKSERNFGCEEMEQKDMRYEDNSAKSLEIFSNQYTESSGNPTGRGITSKRANNHPTVKPIKLMEYLIKLVSKEGSVVLDPFLGSGTTGIACVKLGRKFIGIEKEEEYIKIAQARLKPYKEQQKLKIPTKSETRGRTSSRRIYR